MLQVQSQLHCGGLLFRESLYPDSFSMTMHEDGLTQVIFLLSGEIEHRSPQETHEVSPMMLTFLPQGAPHANRFLAGVRTFELLAFPAFSERLNQVGLTFTEQQIHANSAATGLLQRLYREFHTPDSLTLLQMEGLTLELFVALGRAQGGKRDTCPPRWLQTAREFLQEHFAEDLSLESIANVVGVHPSHLARGFRQHYHCTVGDYLRKLRVDHACILLAHNTHSLAELAVVLGFADQAHFSRVFKQVMGCTPNAFRNATLRQKIT